jgi:transposase
MTYSKDLKWVVISMLIKGKSAEDIAELLELSVPTVFRVQAIHRKYGTVTDPFKSIQGRSRELDPRLLDVTSRVKINVALVFIEYSAGAEE